ncbi:MAG: hypothetical protein ACLQNE_40990 [Thermoguttaceae bacterium]
MDPMKTCELLLGPLLTIILTAIIVPYLRRIYRLHREEGLMIRKKLLEHTGVVIFGVFDGGLQSDYLGGFLTLMFGETLFDLIVGWNNAPSPSVIVPKTAYQCAHLQEILAAHASPFILQSGRIDCYFDGVKAYGTATYKFAKFVVGLARPDANKLISHDYPRVIIVEIDNLKRIAEEEVRPQYETQDGYVWLETVREMGKSYFSGKQQGLVVLEIPLRSGK